MKRYKVVQDARGHWGIWDTEADDFASWGSNPSDSGAWALDDIVYYAGHINTEDGDRDMFEWDGEYLPREKD